MVFSFFVHKLHSLPARCYAYSARGLCCRKASVLLRYRVQMIKGMIESFSPHNSAIIVNVILSEIHSKIPIVRYL